LSDDHGPPKKGAPLPFISPHSGHEEGEGNWLVSYADMMTLLVGFFVILLSFSSVDQEKLEGVREAITKEFGGTYKAPFEQLAKNLEAALKNLGVGNQFVITHNPDGVEISFLGTVFFETGSAELRDEGHALIGKLLPTLHQEAAGFNIVIEGHTDDAPMAAGKLIRSNWELSSLRACRVLDSFAQAGFAVDKLQPIGYADTRPVLPNRDAAGVAIAANQSQNRRVVVKVLKPMVQLIENKKAAPVAVPNAPTEVPPGPPAGEPSAPTESH
jgi:chemotaxis protein MotB